MTRDVHYRSGITKLAAFINGHITVIWRVCSVLECDSLPWGMLYECTLADDKGFSPILGDNQARSLYQWTHYSNLESLLGVGV